MTLREQLLSLAEPDYSAFSSTLMPGIEHVLGIRLPQLRQLARKIARGDWAGYLDSAQSLYFEERMLQGMVIGYLRCPVEQKLERVARFVPRIDNWAICDSFCWHLRAEEREPMWLFIQPYFHSSAEYEVRFAVVMGLTNFIDPEHAEQLLERLGDIHHEAYYARMGVAWAVSILFVKLPDRTLAWLRECSLADWTFNKALQKITESLRVDEEQKQLIRSMKRHRK